MMMLKRLLAICTLLLLCVAPPPAYAAKSYAAERFDVDWRLTEGGVLEVTETVAFRFTGGPFTFVFRELPTDYSDGISDITATLDGQPLPRGSRAGQVEVESGDPIKVTWHFAPTSDATHTFGLTYRIAGVVRQEAGADRFVWNALPTEYEYTIAESTVRLTYPAGATRLGPPEIQRGQAQVATGDGSLMFTSANLRPDTPLTVAVDFTPGSLIAAPPKWQARSLATQRSLPGFGGAALALLAAGVAGLSALWRKGRRQEPAATPVEPVVATPPSDLAPAAAGALLANGAPSAVNALGTLFQLAQRGLLRIEESEKKWFRSRDFIVRQIVPAPASLLGHEAGLLDLIFEEKRGRQEAVRMSEMGTRLARRLAQFSKPLNEELAEAGLLDAGRQALRKRFAIIGVVALILIAPALVVALLLMSGFGAAPFVLLAPPFVVAIVAFILSAAYSPLSDAGAEQAARWRAFQNHLKAIAKGRESAWDLTLFERYLPYAAAFGQIESWAKAYQAREGRAIPDWFRALSGSNEDGWIAFITMTSFANTTSSPGGGGAGSGGAGGGGSSGAG